MTQQSDVSYELPRDKEAIMKIFKRYDFRDTLDHPLHMCLDFILLVDHYCGEDKPDEKAE